MPNINYTLGKDYLTFSGVDSNIIYYLIDWQGLGFTTDDVTTGSFYGPIYNPGSTLVYNTFAATFAVDEEWRVFEKMQKLVIQNTTLDSSSSTPSLFDATLHLMSNTYQKEVAYIIMHDAYVQSIQNVENRYNTEDNTQVKSLQCIIKYQYHEFFRVESD